MLHAYLKTDCIELRKREWKFAVRNVNHTRSSGKNRLRSFDWTRTAQKMKKNGGGGHTSTKRARWSHNPHSKYFFFGGDTQTDVSRDSAVGIATSYWLDDVEVPVPLESRIFTSPRRSDRLWGPPNLLFNGYRGSVLGGKAAGAWNWPLTSN
jgi:hypothetical protein